MKTKGLCSTCDNNVHCVLTKESGVLECEEFLVGSKLSSNKSVCQNKQARVNVSGCCQELEE